MLTITLCKTTIFTTPCPPIRSVIPCVFASFTKFIGEGVQNNISLKHWICTHYHFQKHWLCIVLSKKLIRLKLVLAEKCSGLVWRYSPCYFLPRHSFASECKIITRKSRTCILYFRGPAAAPPPSLLSSVAAEVSLGRCSASAPGGNMDDNRRHSPL